MRKSVLAKNIKKLRLYKGMNQTEFAELFGINRSNIGSYEEARAEPKLEVLLKIAKHFKLTVDQVVSKELSVNEIAGFQLDYTNSGLSKSTKTMDHKLDEILERIAAMEKKLSDLAKKK